MLKVWTFFALAFLCSWPCGQTLPTRTDVSNFLGRLYQDAAQFGWSPQAVNTGEKNVDADNIGDSPRTIAVNVASASSTEKPASAARPAFNSITFTNPFNIPNPLLTLNFADDYRISSTTTKAPSKSTTELPPKKDPALEDLLQQLPELIEAIKDLIASNSKPPTKPRVDTVPVTNSPLIVPALYQSPQDLYSMYSGYPLRQLPLNSLQANGRLPMWAMDKAPSISGNSLIPESYIRQAVSDNSANDETHMRQVLERLLRIAAATTTTTPAPKRPAQGLHLPWLPVQYGVQGLHPEFSSSGNGWQLVMTNEEANGNERHSRKTMTPKNGDN